jgi:acetyltransferase-like isoleucine patch superfamily enzyme
MQCGVFLGGSVLGCGARIGSGVITANRKFNQTEIYVKDSAASSPRGSGREFFGAIIGRYCRLGANVVTYPGTILREHTWVGAGCVLHGTYGPDEFISVKQELDIRPKQRLNLRSGKGEYEHV